MWMQFTVNAIYFFPLDGIFPWSFWRLHDNRLICMNICGINFWTPSRSWRPDLCNGAILTLPASCFEKTGPWFSVCLMGCKKLQTFHSRFPELTFCFDLFIPLHDCVWHQLKMCFLSSCIVLREGKGRLMSFYKLHFLFLLKFVSHNCAGISTWTFQNRALCEFNLFQTCASCNRKLTMENKHGAGKNEMRTQHWLNFRDILSAFSGVQQLGKCGCNFIENVEERICV